MKNLRKVYKRLFSLLLIFSHSPLGAPLFWPPLLKSGRLDPSRTENTRRALKAFVWLARFPPRASLPVASSSSCWFSVRAVAVLGGRFLSRAERPFCFILLCTVLFILFLKSQILEKKCIMGSLSNLDNFNDRELQEILEIQKREEELKRRMQQDDCDIVQENGQLKFGGPPPSKYCLFTLCLNLANLFFFSRLFHVVLINFIQIGKARLHQKVVKSLLGNCRATFHSKSFIVFFHLLVRLFFLLQIVSVSCCLFLPFVSLTNYCPEILKIVKFSCAQSYYLHSLDLKVHARLISLKLQGFVHSISYLKCIHHLAVTCFYQPLFGLLNFTMSYLQLLQDGIVN